MDRLLNKIGDIVFPPNISCISCKESIDKRNPYSLCHSCYLKLKFTDEVCPRCGRILSSDSHCYCREEHYYFDFIDTVIAYNRFAQRLVYQYKYGQRTYLCDFFSELLADRIRKGEISYDYITYVPIHRRRERQRGFHQVKIIAEKLGEQMSLPVVDMVIRKEDTPFLSEKKPFERMLLLEHAFEPNRISIQETSRILLIDDIITYGTTLSLVAKEIKKIAPDSKVYAMAVCNARS